MGAFLSAIAGAGHAAIPYGEQIRSQLESRRHDFADLIGKAALEEADPQTRTSLLQHQADLLAGKPIGSVAQKFSTTMQKLHKDNQALQSVFGGPPKEPNPVPGSAPGVTPGQPVAPVQARRIPSPFEGYISNFQPQESAPPAAQPATNPIAGPQGPIKVPSASDAHWTQNSTAWPESRVGGPWVARPIQQESVSSTINFGPATGTSQQAAPLTDEASVPGRGQDATSAPAIAPIPTSIQPVANDPRAMRASIIQKYDDLYRSATPAMRPLILAEMNNSLAQLQPFEQTAQRRAEFEVFKETPEFKALPPYVKAAYAAQASGFQPVNMPQGMLVPNKLQTTAGALDAATKKQFGLEGLPDEFPVTISRSRTDNSIVDATPGNPGIAVITNADGTQSFVQKTPGASAGVASGLLRPMNTGVDPNTHRNVYVRPFDLLPSTGHNPTSVALGINPAFIPSQTVSTVTQPGQLPVTTSSVRTKGGGGAAGGSAPITPVPRTQSASPTVTKGDPVIKRKYDDWVAGASVPTGKDLTAVQDYAAKNDLPSPVALSAAGQKIMEGVESTTKQVEGLLDRLKDLKGKDLTADYLKYKYLGKKTPYDDIFSGVAFTDLRSAAAALQGVSARGEKVLREGLAHTPTFDRLGGFNPDSVDLMIDKFEEARKLIAGDKESALRNMTKTGIIRQDIQPIATLPAAAVSRLKEGHDTTFANGQVWRLVGGKPRQVINGQVQ